MSVSHAHLWVPLGYLITTLDSRLFLREKGKYMHYYVKKIGAKPRFFGENCRILCNLSKNLMSMQCSEIRILHTINFNDENSTF